MKLTFRERDEDVDLVDAYSLAKLNIIHCLPNMNVEVYRVEGLKKKRDILNKLKSPEETLRLRDFREKYAKLEGDIWGPFEESECVRQFMNADKLAKSRDESIVDGVTLAKEVQAVPIVEASVDMNAKNIQRLATAVVETTELKEEPPEKEIAETDKILLCNRFCGDYSGRKVCYTCGTLV